MTASANSSRKSSSECEKPANDHIMCTTVYEKEENTTWLYKDIQEWISSNTKKWHKLEQEGGLPLLVAAHNLAFASLYFQTSGLPNFPSCSRDLWCWCRARKKDWDAIVQWASESSMFVVVLWASWKEPKEQACFITCPETFLKEFSLGGILCSNLFVGDILQ